MAERTANEVFWGTFGDAHYSLDQHKWLFSRRLRQLSRTATPLLRETDIAQYADKESTLRQEQNRDPEKHVHKLVRSFPELHVASDVIVDEFSEQHVENKLGATEKSLRGVLLAVGLLHPRGHRSYGDSSDQRPYLLVVTPSGSLGHELSVTLAPPRHEIHESGTIQYFPISSAKRQLWQNSSMEPICQLCCSSALEDGSILIGVRRASRVDIIIVLPGPDQYAHDDAIGEPREDRVGGLRLIAQWNQDADRHVYYMDFTFHPRDPSCMALIDSSGSWKSYKLSELSKYGNYRTTSQGKSSKRQDGQTVSDVEDQASQWRRILWVRNDNMLLVCTRTVLEIFDAETGQSLMREAFEASAHERNMQITDIKRNPKAVEEVFVLTTVHIIWLRVRVDDKNDIGLDFVYQLPHGRDQDDLTLGISFLHDSDGTSLALYSGNVPLLEIYNFGYQNGGDASLPLVSDPLTISHTLMPPGRDQGGFRTFRPTLTAHVQMLQEYAESTSSQSSFTCQTFILNNGFELEAQVYRVGRWRQSINTHMHGPSVRANSELSDFEALSSESEAGHASELADAFIVEDNDQSSDDNKEVSHISPLFKNSLHAPAVKGVPSESSGSLSWTLSNEDLYNAILDASRRTNDVDYSLWAERQLHHLSPQSSFGPLQEVQSQSSILDLKIPDMDKVTRAMKSMLSRLSGEPQSLNLKNIRNAQSIRKEPPTPTTVYHEIQELWGSYGQTSTGGSGVRLKQKLMRCLALELYLSDFTIVPPASVDSVRGLAANLDAEQVMNKTIERLRTHTDITGAAPLLTSASANVLAHWEVGEDPANYDHIATSARISSTPAGDAGQAGPSKSGKLARALHDKRMKQEQRHRDDSRMTASQPYALHTNQDSPQLYPPGVENSSQDIGASSAQQAVTGSQPVPGVHGSRKTGLAFRTAKGKGIRKAGF